MARAGHSYVDILSYFYKGATFTTYSQDAPVHILLYTRGPFRAVGEGGPFHWTDAAGRHEGQPGTPVAVTPGVRIDPDSPSTRLTLVGAERTRTYRGSLVGSTVAGTARVINVVSLEDYLRGLGEVPSNWPLEAIKAQVVAARCYALTHLGGGAFDMDDTTRYQVYGGVGYESSNQSAAVDATQRQALMYNGHPIIAFFSSSDGGHTANVWDVFGGSQDRYPYLEGVRDNFDVESPMHTWYTDVYSVETLEKIYFTPADINQWGHLRSLDLTRRDPSKRLRSVGLVGTGGTKWIPVGAFMDKFNDPGQPLTGVDALWNDMFGVSWSSGGWPHGW
jgi:peptidoglycan hydrolase-like amidase